VIDPHAGSAQPPTGTHASFVVYAPGDRPDVEVLIETTWYPGELRMWSKKDARWVAQCTYRTEPGKTRIASVDQDNVRLDTTATSRPGTGN
jgi:hypothetical protein